MDTIRLMRRLAAGLLLPIAWTAAVAGTPPASSGMALGLTNPLLAQGADELQAGHWMKGVELTLEGLKAAASNEDLAAGHSNACAGYAMLKQWDDALTHCNAALELDASNWHVYNNRAAIYVAKGLLDLATHDIETGLSLAPHAATLQESMRVLEHDKRLMGRRDRRSVQS